MPIFENDRLRGGERMRELQRFNTKTTEWERIQYPEMKLGDIIAICNTEVPCIGKVWVVVGDDDGGFERGELPHNIYVEQRVCPTISNCPDYSCKIPRIFTYEEVKNET